MEIFTFIEDSMVLRSTISICARLRSAAFLLASFCLLASSAHAADKCGSLDRVMVALRLTRALYPDLKGRELSVAFSLGYPSGGPISFPTDARTLRITVDKPQWQAASKGDDRSDAVAQAPLAEESAAELPLYFNFDFTDNNSAGGEVVCRPQGFIKSVVSKQMQEALTAINNHINWTRGEALAAARRQGMKFGPADRAALLKALPLTELSLIYGPFRIEEAHFTLVNGPQKTDVKNDFAELYWSLTAREINTRRGFVMMIEPFQGRIFSVSESDYRWLGVSEHREPKRK